MMFDYELSSIAVIVTIIALMVVIWYSLIRYQRQFPIAMILSGLLFVLAIVDAVIRLTWFPLVIALIAAMTFVTLVIEQRLREKHRKEKDAGSEEDEVDE